MGRRGGDGDQGWKGLGEAEAVAVAAYGGMGGPTFTGGG